AEAAVLMVQEHHFAARESYFLLRSLKPSFNASRTRLTWCFSYKALRVILRPAFASPRVNLP
ncbi:MAG: hypothetical protein RSB16_00755, partial [Raoultibacter sp.]